MASSAHRDEVDAVNLTGFTPELALWGVHGSALGALRLAVQAFFTDVTRAN